MNERKDKHTNEQTHNAEKKNNSPTPALRAGRGTQIIHCNGNVIMSTANFVGNQGHSYA